MFRRGTKIFSAGTIFIFIIAFLHTISISNEPIDPEGVALIEAMKSYTLDMVIMESNYYNIQTSLGLTMALLLFLMGLINVLIATSGAYLIRKVSGVNAVFMWALSGLYYYFMLPPPLLAFLIAAILFSLSFLLTRGNPGFK
jgi:hypothetical protein